MTELILKDRIDRQRLNSIVTFLKSWGIEAEVKTTTTPKIGVEKPFSQSFGMWADRDIDIKEIRQKTYERRMKSYENDTL